MSVWLTSALLVALAPPPAVAPTPAVPASAPVAPAPTPVAPAPTPVVAPVAPAPLQTGRFTGVLSDGAGSVRFRLRGRGDEQRVSHATAEFHGRSYSLRTSDVTDGRFMLSGNRDKDYVRIKVQLRRNGRWASGTFDGLAKKKAVRGRFTAARR